MASKNNILIIDDQRGYLDIVSHNNNSPTSRYNLLLAKDVLSAINIIKDENINFVTAAVDLNLDFSEEGYPDEYGWMLIALLRFLRPTVSITLNSNSANKNFVLLKAKFSLNVENICYKDETHIIDNLEKLTVRDSIPLPDKINTSFNRFMNSSITPAILKQVDGVSPLDLLLLEFLAIKENFPGGKHGKYGLGLFLPIIDEGLDNSERVKLLKNRATKAKFKAIEMLQIKDIIVKDQKLDIHTIIKLLVENNLTRKTIEAELTEIKDVLIELMDNPGLTVKEAADKFKINRSTLTRKIIKFYNTHIPATPSQIAPTPNERARTLCMKFFPESVR